jgi:hypothetical protein
MKNGEPQKEMTLGAAFLMRLAGMICGDEPFTFFPYRSSSKLTRFFVSLDLNYVHDGSTRINWVNDALTKLNKKEGKASMPSRELISVIESVVHPDNFLFDEKVDHLKAIQAMNDSLKSSGLILAASSDRVPRLAPIHGEFVSTSHEEVQTERLITFKPSVFTVPKDPPNPKLISVMMPFNPAFKGTYDAVYRVADHMSLECLRADDIWNSSTFIQDIFSLIFRSHVVVVDFTGRNSNVMYETGIAHTLGKTVVPITQSLDDIPSDLGHHRALKYLPNEEGYRDLSNSLWKRFRILFNTSAT